MATLQTSKPSALEVSTNPRVQQHYVTQAGLLVLLIRALKKLWPTIDRNDLKTTQPVYVAQVAQLVEEYARASIEIALQYFEDERASAGITDRFSPPIVDPPTFAQIEDSVKGAMDDLWSSPGTVTLDVIDAPPIEDIETSVQAKVEGAVEMLVADAGRNEMMEAIDADTKVRAYARITKPGACAFCMMLATRGAVYKSKATAGVIADAVGDEINRYHPECHCTVQAIYADHFEASAAVRESAALWETPSVKNVRGSKAKQKAFRRAYEGRADGPTRKSRSGRARTRGGIPVVDTATLGFDNLTPDQLRQQLSVLEGLKDSDYRTKAIAKARARLAEIG